MLFCGLLVFEIRTVSQNVLLKSKDLEINSSLAKPPLDTSVFRSWATVGNVSISKDGKFAFYTIRYGSLKQDLVVKTINGSWKKEFHDVERAVFTSDSKKTIFRGLKDTLYIFDLTQLSIESIPQVKSFDLFRYNTEEWMVYRKNSAERGLFFLNLITGDKQAYRSVKNYLLSPEAKTLLIQSEDNDTVVTKWRTFPHGHINKLWYGSNASQFVFDRSGTQLAFIVDTTLIPDRVSSNTLWYFKIGMDRPIMIASNKSKGIDSGQEIQNISARFSKDGKKLFFSLKDKPPRSSTQEFAKVDIWSYHDPILQSAQLEDIKRHSFISSITLQSGEILRLQKEDESLQLFTDDQLNDVALTVYQEGHHTERYWNSAAIPQCYIRVISEPEKKLIKIEGVKSFWIDDISPDGKFLIGTDLDAGDLHCYEILTGHSRNLTKRLPIPTQKTDIDEPGIKSRGLILAGWSENRNSLLIYDDYDIWKIDLYGNQNPINLTNGYGRRHKTVLRFAEGSSANLMPDGEPILLSAFNKTSKHSGLYSINSKLVDDPKLLFGGPFTCNLVEKFSLNASDTVTLFLIRKSSAEDSENYFVTTDFRQFTPITDVYPEKKYNWLTSKLLSWLNFDGRLNMGVLYKPENFNPAQKYPVILYFYEQLSDDVHQYKKPEECVGWINIPWFVSNGFLVFTPDIRYRIGAPGKSAFNSIVSAAEYLKTFNWVDHKRIGICGHSWGGYETNYVITHTKIFTAAVSACGISDMISGYGSLSHGAVSTQHMYEISQFRIGATLWDNPQLYIINSPIFRANKVTTPLLMMGNKKDDAVSFTQSLELFTALRRLRKKVWMLQYDDEGHSLIKQSSKIDYTIRVTQFFNHYLKGDPPPRWMVRGISAKEKGIEKGFEIDHK